MKIIQLNVWQGRVAEKTLQLIRDEKPDILCSQEVYSSEVKIPSFYHLDIHEQISKFFKYNSFVKTHELVVAGQRVSYGNAIYSNWPIKDDAHIYTNGSMQIDSSIEDFDYNVRAVQVATVTTPEGDVQIYNHHGYHDANPLGNQQTLASHRKVASFIQENKSDPIIVCGDFNSSPNSSATNILNTLELRNHVLEHSSIDSTLGRLSRVENRVICDYIFTSKDVRVKHFEALDKLASDHKALIMEFSL